MATYLGGGGGDVSASPTDEFGNGTREYNVAASTRTTVTSPAAAAVAFGALGASREVMFVANTRCFLKFGTSDQITTPVVTDTDLLALPADAMFHLRVPKGVTHFRVVRDSADGFIRCTPVV